MSLVHKTIAATIVSGVALMGAAGTAHATVAKPTPVAVKKLHVYSPTTKHWTSRALGKVVFRGKLTTLTGLAENKTKKKVYVKITIVRGKISTPLKPIAVPAAGKLGKPGYVLLGGKKGLHWTGVTSLRVSIGTGAAQTIKATR
ncbi:hypothetical protein NE236_12115 [Actinoallomurus purpureus]|uniref:hypothetical protein n=1 Tax=Actinoallomurus purpureus TaxID=478114 RepID=UPI0020920545|nr:hypothetical protein [Actinoallomurus purpureus]MCO6005729.1 hypothetical protein [Actinoallomurus purpureus]